MNFTWFVEMEPTGKGRPRYTKSGLTYTPKPTKDAEAKIIAAFREKYGTLNVPAFPKGTGVTVGIECFFEIPKSYTKKDIEEIFFGRAPTVKPDIDNIEKLVLDAINHTGLWEDDVQVVHVNAIKRYCRPQIRYMDTPKGRVSTINRPEQKSYTAISVYEYGKRITDE